MKTVFSPVSPIMYYFDSAGRYNLCLSKLTPSKNVFDEFFWDPMKIHYFQGFLGSFILRP